MGKQSGYVSEVSESMNRKPVIQSLPSFDGRTIVISDLHGSLDVYEKLLKKVDYVPEQDRLILLGDLVEKGTQNLALLHRIMEQSTQKEVYPVMGNCDFVAKNILYAYRLDYLRTVLLQRKNSLIHEMIAEAGLPELNEETDMQQLARELRKRYLPELTFLNDLPHVIETPQAIFAHSGIVDEKNFADDFREIMTRFQFAREDVQFSRPVIVGHMPVSEYCSRYASFNPRFEREKNIYSIDGGNAVKKAGQLNALILMPSVVQYVHTDLLDKVRVLHSTKPDNTGSFFLNWSDGQVELLEQNETESLVYAPGLHRRVVVDNEFLRDGRASNFTSYELPLVAGHTVHLVNVWGHKAQVKHHGILGWTDISNLDLSEDQLNRPLDLS